MSSTPICPCEGAEHPRIITNPAARDTVDYRIGDYATFRQALLRPRPDETALAGWHPVAGADLALQLLEWWAYLADVLTFYNERALHEVLLRTAVLPEDVRRIVRLLGYRPRPGIGATGVVAALTDSTEPFVLPRGFPIEGGSAPGQPAQIFEVDDDIEIGRLGRPLPTSARLLSDPGRAGQSGQPIPGVAGALSAGFSMGSAVRGPDGRLVNDVRAIPATEPPPIVVNAGWLFDVTLDGVVATLKPDDVILVLRRDWDGAPDSGFALAMVQAVAHVLDENGHAVTTLTSIAAHSLPGGIAPANCRILRATKLAHLWLYHDRHPVATDLPPLVDPNLLKNVALDMFLGPFSFLAKDPPPARPQPRQDPRVLAGLSALPDPDLNNSLSGLAGELVRAASDPIGFSLGKLNSLPVPPSPASKPAASTPPHGVAHLEAITRGISAGDPVLFEKRSGGGLPALFARMASSAFTRSELPSVRALVMQLVKVTGYAEDIWYANAPQADSFDSFGQGPPVGPPVGPPDPEGPIPIPHSRITFEPNVFLDMMAAGGKDLNTIVVHYGWQVVGQIVPPPAPKVAKTVKVAELGGVPPGVPVPVLIEDAVGDGVPGELGKTQTTGGKELVPPLQALLNLLPVSRGQTVADEILGSGDPLLAWQEFALQRAPLTYLADTGPRSFHGYRSTLRVRVDGIEWREVASFYGQGPDARVFVTREDDEQRTHVRFGDGDNGARLPAGIDNVVARYRQGSGAALPRARSLTTMLRPEPGVRAIRNPVPVGGGADPDPPDQLRRYAPRSVLTFGRAISGDDYETVAAQTPGVQRARVYWSWDAGAQRTLVKVFVGDDDAAVAAARTALRAVADPNRPAVVALAAPVVLDLRITLVVDPSYDVAAVTAAVTTALLDPQRPPFGSSVVRIGAAVYDSQIYDACLSVPGVVAVHGLRFGVWTRTQVPLVLLPLLFGVVATLPASASAAATASAPIRKNPLIAPLDMLGTVFDQTGLLGPTAGTTVADIRDPFALPTGLVPVPPQPTPPGPPPVTEKVQLDPGPRHSPGEGGFYLLLEERLHLSAEIARHVL